MRTHPELSVEMWYCGDEECACERPEVVVRYPFDKPEPGVGICKTIASGPFYSFAYSDHGKKERAEQKRWINQAERWYKTRHVCPRCAPARKTDAKEGSR